MTALLRQVLSMGNQTLPESTRQQGVAVVVCRVTEVLAGHTDPAGSGLLKHSVVHVVPFLFRHRTLLLSSSHVLVMVPLLLQATHTNCQQAQKEGQEPP